MRPPRPLPLDRHLQTRHLRHKRRSLRRRPRMGLLGRHSNRRIPRQLRCHLSTLESWTWGWRDSEVAEDCGDGKGEGDDYYGTGYWG